MYFKNVSYALRLLVDNHGSIIKILFIIIGVCLGSGLAVNLISRAYGQDVFPDNLAPTSLPCIKVYLTGLIVELLLFLALTYWREIRRGFDMREMINLRNEEDDDYRIDKTILDGMGISLSDKGLALSFLMACLSPKEVFTCIDERIRTHARSLTVESHISFRRPYSTQTPFFIIPLFFHCRGDYPDSLEAKGHVSDELLFLNLTDTFDYMQGIIDLVLPELSEPSSSELRSKILSFISSRESMTEEAVVVRYEDYKEIKKEVAQLNPKENRFQERTELFGRLLEKLIESYPICIRCAKAYLGNQEKPSTDGKTLTAQAQRAQTVSLAVSYRLPLVHTPGRWLLGKRGRIRYYAADAIRRPNTIFYGLGNAERTQSYHLQANGAPNSFCAVAALRRIEPDTTSKCSSAYDAYRVNREHQIGYPSAEMAYAQTRCGQEHFSMCVKNGSRFANWVIMYRHVSRNSDTYRFALAITLLASAMLWIYIGELSSGVSEGGGQGATSSVLGAFITCIASAGVTWIVKEEGDERGREIGPQLTILLVSISALLVLLSLPNLGNEPNKITYCIPIAFAVLFSVCLLMIAHLIAQWMVRGLLRREPMPAVDLIWDKGNDGKRRHGKIWSPGWLAVDGNRYIASRFDDESV